MLARSNEPTSSQISMAVPPAGGITRARVEAFGRAERHSRRVWWLKRMLPVAAVAMAAAFAGYSYLSNPMAVAVTTEGAAFAEGKLVMENPKLEGFTKDGRPYSMTALRAIQALDKQGVFNLEGINAKMPVEQDNWTTVEAKSGVYDRTTGMLELTSDITVTTTDGMVAKLKTASVNIGMGRMRTSDPVDIQRNGSTITADSMNIHDNGKVLIFTGRVRMNLNPVEMKTVEQASGGTDASN